MAVPRVYKSITDHRKVCESAETFMQLYGSELAESLTEVFQKDLSEGAAAPDIVPFVDALLRRLRSTLDDLLEAEKKHLSEIGNDAEFRVARDRAAEPLRRSLIDLRGTFRSAFGFEKSQSVGFESEIVSDSAAMLRQADRLLDNLRDPAFELPTSQYEGIAVTPELIVAQLESHYKALEEALGDVRQEHGKTHGTQIAKDEALAAFRRTYALFLRILQGSFRLAGETELAARLRQTVRRTSPSRAGEEPEPARSGDGQAGDGQAGDGQAGSTPQAGDEPASGLDEADADSHD